MQKERYFTPETIRSKSKEMLASVIENRRRHANLVFQPRSAALLVLDLQEYFLQETSHAFVPSAPAILSGIGNMITAFLDAGGCVVSTCHSNTLEDAGMMAKWWHGLMVPDSAHSHNIALIKQPNILHFNKTQYDAFLHTTLEHTLREQGIEQVVICGVMTHLCCETTARSAFMRGFGVFFTVDGTATYNEELHRASLLTLSHGFAVPVLMEELLGQMESDETR